VQVEHILAVPEGKIAATGLGLTGLVLADPDGGLARQKPLIPAVRVTTSVECNAMGGTKALG
jgi:hypothetical protein